MARRKPNKLTGSAKTTLTAITLLGFVGGWSMIAHQEQKSAQASPAPPPPPPTTSLQVVQPLTIPPVPTLIPTLTTVNVAFDNDSTVNMALPEIAPLPTLAPLPTMAPLPDLPPPPPPPQWDNQNWSGSS